MNVGYIKIFILVVLLLIISISIYQIVKRKQSLKKIVSKALIYFTGTILIFLYILSYFTIPIITLRGSEDVTIKLHDEYNDSGCDVMHSLNDDNKLIITSNLDVDKVGTYEYVYKIKHYNREIMKKRIIHVIDDINPVIELSGGEITIYQNGIFDEPGYIATDNYDGDITNKVIVTNNIKDEIGSYVVNYSVTDSSGNSFSIDRNVYRKNSDGVIYFTFDDGPSNSTSQILDILKKYNIKATFFVINFSSDYEPVIKRMKEEGHTIALHSYTHNYSHIYSSVDAYFDDLNKIQNRVYEVTGLKPTITRFPGGSSNTVSKFNKGIMSTLTKEVNNRGYHYFDWNVDSSDAWSAKNSADVYNNVISTLRKNRNNIVLMHDFSNNNKTIEALENVIKKAIDSGYTFNKITMDTPVVHHGIKN